jgi:hypothetical protein
MPHTPLTWHQLIFIVPSTEISIGGTALCGATGITKNATEELKTLSQSGFQECFHHFYIR